MNQFECQLRFKQGIQNVNFISLACWEGSILENDRKLFCSVFPWLLYEPTSKAFLLRNFPSDFKNSYFDVVMECSKTLLQNVEPET